jgi:hypothetical protein
LGQPPSLLNNHKHGLFFSALVLGRFLTVKSVFLLSHLHKLYELQVSTSKGVYYIDRTHEELAAVQEVVSFLFLFFSTGRKRHHTQDCLRHLFSLPVREPPVHQAKNFQEEQDQGSYQSEEKGEMVLLVGSSRSSLKG